MSSRADPGAPSGDDARLLAVEEKLAHLEHGMAQLDEVVREVADALVAVRAELAQLRAERARDVEAARSEGESPMSREEQLVWDKPPHW